MTAETHSSANLSGIDFPGLLAGTSQEALAVVKPESTSSGGLDFRCVWASVETERMLNIPVGSLVGRLVSDFVPRDHALFEMILRSESERQILTEEFDAGPEHTITRFTCRIVPSALHLGISIVDRSPIRQIGDRANWLEGLITGGAKSSVVAAAVLRPILQNGAPVDFEFEAINDLGGEMLGVRSQDIGRRLSEWSELPPGEGLVARKVVQSWRSRELTTFETSAVGTKVKADWLRCQVTPLDSRVILHVVDISEQRVSEMALAASEQLFRSVFEVAAEGIALIERNGTLRVANQAFAEMFRSTRDDLVGKSVAMLMPGDELGPNIELSKIALRTGQPTAPHRHHRLLRRDGMEFWASVSTALTRNADGDADGFVLIVSDIDEQLRSADALALSEARYRAIVEPMNKIKNYTNVINTTYRR